ncbi:hypothetical protein OH77DRAFT_1520816 [Trametes cingulata]|nr:hypothetical protein OH77DRAFT_1520816 [Trametes cingulata]
METPFQDAWTLARDARDARLKTAEQKRANERALLQAVTVVCWLKDGQAPKRHAIQGIETWPTLNLAQIPETLSALGLEESDRIELYLVDSFSWQQHSVNHVFEVKPKQLLLLRRAGVSLCLDIDYYLAEARGQLQLVSSIRTTAPGMIAAPAPVVGTSSLPSLKRQREEDDTTARPSVVARMGLAHVSPLARPVLPTTYSPYPASDLYHLRAAVYSPQGSTSSSSTRTTPHLDASVPSSPSHSGRFMDLSHASELQVGLGLMHSDPPAPSSPYSIPAPPTPLATPGLSVLQGSILSSHTDTGGNSSGTVEPWPHGVYACDMARGFAAMAALDDKEFPTLKDRMALVFPDVNYVHTTAYRQYRAWKLSGPNEQQALLAVPRTEAGLWVRHRVKLKGWSLSRPQK